MKKKQPQKTQYQTCDIAMKLDKKAYLLEMIL